MDLHPLSAPRDLEVHEVAFLLRCSQETVRRLIRYGKLEAFRVGAHLRVKAADLDTYRAAQRVHPNGNGNGHPSDDDSRGPDNGSEA